VVVADGGPGRTAGVGGGGALDPAQIVVLGELLDPLAGEAQLQAGDLAAQCVVADPLLAATGGAGFAVEGSAAGAGATGAAVEGGGLPGAGIASGEVAGAARGMAMVAGDELAGAGVEVGSHLGGGAEAVAGHHLGGLAAQAVPDGVDVAATAVIGGGVDVAAGLAARRGGGAHLVAEPVVAVGGGDLQTVT